MSEDKENSFAHDLSKLEQIITSMNQDELELEDNLRYFAQGMELIRKCRKVLDEAEQKVKVLVKSDDGEVVEKNVEFGNELD